MNNEQTNAIKQNLIANGLLITSYNPITKKVEYKITDTGLRMYATMLRLLNISNIENCLYMDEKSIKEKSLDNLSKMIFREQFCQWVPLENKYVLTYRGMEHIKTLFSLNNKTQKPSIFRRIFGLKG